MSSFSNVLKNIIREHIDKSMNTIEKSASKTKSEVKKFKDWCQKAKAELDKMAQGEFGEEQQAMAKIFEKANQKAIISVDVLNTALRAMRELSDAILQTIK